MSLVSEIDGSGAGGRTDVSVRADAADPRSAHARREVLATALCLGSAAAVVALLGWGLQSGPLSGDPVLSGSIVAAAVLLGLGGLTCMWTLPRVDVKWRRDGWTATAILISLTGLAVLGWSDGPAVLRSTGGVVGPLIVPALLEPVARRALRPRAAAWLMWVSVGLVAGASFTVYLVRDPFHDPECWSDCALQDVAPLPSRPATEVVVRAFAVAVALVAFTSWALVARMLARQRRVTTLLGLAVATTATLALTAAASLSLLADHAAKTLSMAIMATMLAVFGVLIAVDPVLALRRRRLLRQLAFALGEAPAPGTLEPALARALGDRELRVAYWLPESRMYVAADGREVPEAAGWTVTLSRDDEPLAALHLGRTDRNPTEVQELVGSAARLAIDSERLEAEIRAQLAELQGSRQRIVAAADGSRRRVERTIHDVVQAELLGALFDLARARNVADQAGDRVASDQLAEISGEVGAVVASIREFARGVYPAALDASGLAAALGALADDAPVVLTVQDTLTTRLPAELERTIYLLVQHVVAHAVADLAVRINRVGPEVVVRISDVREPLPDHLTDRIGALGGRYRVQGVQVEVSLPCR